MALRIATFNLKDFFIPRSDAERSVAVRKFENIVGTLRRADADVVALQEVGEPEQLARVTHDLSDRGYHTVLGDPDKRGIRCAVLSRLPVLWSQVHTSKSLPFPAFQEGDAEPFGERIPLRRALVHVRVEAPEVGEVDVITAHFKSNLATPKRTHVGAPLLDDTFCSAGESAVRSFVSRTAEALYLRDVVDRLFRHATERAVCVLGDLNDHRDSLPVRIVSGVGGLRETPELSKTRLHSLDEFLAPERRYSCFHGTSKTLLDHILVSERLQRVSTSLEIYNEELRYHGPHVEGANPTADSDHALCVATFL